MLPAVPQVTIAVADPRAADVTALLAQHLAFTAAHSPPQDVHALNVEELLAPAVTLYGYRLDANFSLWAH